MWNGCANHAIRTDGNIAVKADGGLSHMDPASLGMFPILDTALEYRSKSSPAENAVL